MRSLNMPLFGYFSIIFLTCFTQNLVKILKELLELHNPSAMGIFQSDKSIYAFKNTI